MRKTYENELFRRFFTYKGKLALLAFIYVAAAINVYFLIPETKNKELID